MKLRHRIARLGQRDKIMLVSCWILMGVVAAVAAMGLALAATGDDGLQQAIALPVCAALMAAQPVLAGLLLSRLESSALERLAEQNEKAMRDFQLKEREQRHDLNIHLMAVAGMLDAGRYDDCLSYVSDMLDASQEISQLMPFDDPAVSALLNQLLMTARSHGVELSVTAYDDLARVVCEPYELNQVLGNLVRNAIEAAETLPEGRRQVEVVTLARRGRCIIRVENELPEGSEVDDRIFAYGVSGKSGHAGIGLAAILSLVESYGGSLSQEQHDGRICLIAQMPKREE